MYYFRKRKRRSKQLAHQPSFNQSTVRGRNNEAIYDTIDDFSRQGSKYSKSGTDAQGYSDAFSASPNYNSAPGRMSNYNTIGATDDDYNRINLRRHKVSHDPDYNRLPSDTDSGRGDSSGILQMNSNDDVNTDRISDNFALSVLNDSKTNVTNNANTSSDTEIINTEQTAENTNNGLKRTDSYETPEIKLNTNESSLSDNETAQNITNDGQQMTHFAISEKSISRENVTRRDSYETPAIQTNIDTKGNHCILDYETAVPASCTDSSPSGDTHSVDGSNIQFKYEEDKRITSTAENEPVELPRRSNNSLDTDSDSD